MDSPRKRSVIRPMSAESSSLSSNCAQLTDRRQRQGSGSAVLELAVDVPHGGAPQSSLGYTVGPLAQDPGRSVTGPPLRCNASTQLGRPA